MRSTRWSGSNERHVAGRKNVHSCFVAEDAAPTELTAGINGEHRNLLAAFLNQISPQCFDQTALAGTGYASDSNADRISAGGQAFFDDLLGQLTISQTRAFNQCDGFGECRAISFQDAFNELRREMLWGFCDLLRFIRQRWR